MTYISKRFYYGVVSNKKLYTFAIYCFINMDILNYVTNNIEKKLQNKIFDILEDYLYTLKFTSMVASIQNLFGYLLCVNYLFEKLKKGNENKKINDYLCELLGNNANKNSENAFMEPYCGPSIEASALFIKPIKKNYYVPIMQSPLDIEDIQELYILDKKKRIKIS